jgi:hypothetical protein
LSKHRTLKETKNIEFKHTLLTYKRKLRIRQNYFNKSLKIYKRLISNNLTKQLKLVIDTSNHKNNTKYKKCIIAPIEILVLDVGIDEWDWIYNSDCSNDCIFTPCCKNRNIGQEEYTCNSDDVLRADASVVHLEWLGMKINNQRSCGRPCCERWTDIHTQSKFLIGMQSESNRWGYNTDPKVLSSLTHLLTFQSPEAEIYLWMKNESVLMKRPKISQYEFAEPSWAFDAKLLSDTKGISNHPLVSKWVKLTPGPSFPQAISFIQNECKPLYYELVKRNIIIDSYGACEHNRNSGFEMGSWQSDMYMKKLAILSTHMFDLAIENDIEAEWWNTERMYHALLVHTIPIYQGSSTVFKRIPHPDSIIYVNSFGGDMDALASYINNVSVNKTLRDKHLYWTTLHPSQWQNNFPSHQRSNSRLGGAMCKICKNLKKSKLNQCKLY